MGQDEGVSHGVVAHTSHLLWLSYKGSHCGPKCAQNNGPGDHRRMVPSLERPREAPASTHSATATAAAADGATFLRSDARYHRLSFGEAGGKGPTQAASSHAAKTSLVNFPPLTLTTNVKSLETQKKPRSQGREHQAPGPRRIYSPRNQDGADDLDPCRLSNPKRYQLCPCP